MLYKVYYSIGEKKMWMEVEANSHTHAEQVLMQKLTIVKVVQSGVKPEPEPKRSAKHRSPMGDIWDFLQKTGMFQ